MLIAPICLALLPVLAQDPSTEATVREVTAAEIDEVFADADGTDRPGCSVAVVLDGKIVHARGYGMANLEYGIANSAETIFRIGSTSKQFTAACILLAEQEGKLSLDDDVRRFVPELPVLEQYDKAITIRHLVHHTSGVRDYLSLMSYRGMGDLDFYTTDDVVQLLSRQRALNFAPGEQHMYSNSGYLLLAVIIERATGVSLREYAATRIFEPLGMDKSFYCDDTTEIVPLRAEGYVPLGRLPQGGYSIGRTTLNLVGDGAVFTNVLDLAKWDANFYSHKVGGEELHDAQHRGGTLNSGAALEYAAGLDVSEHRGLRLVAHGGSFIGFNAQLIRYPDQRLSVICLSNDDRGRPSQWCSEVADLFLADLYEEDGKRPVQGDPRRGRDTAPEGPALADLSGFAGAFYSAELDVLARLDVEGDRLFYRAGHLDAGPLRVTGDGTRTRGRGMRLSFVRDDEGRVTSFELGGGRASGLKFTRRD